MAHNRVIGAENQIPWYLPADLKYFKKTTIQHPIIMGRKCYESIGRPLPKRHNIILTRDPFFVAQGVLVAHSIEDALEICRQLESEEIFIIGGGEIYKQTMDRVDTLYITEVDLHVDGDVFFPEIDYTQWLLRSESCHEPDEKNEHAYCFKVWDKK